MKRREKPTAAIYVRIDSALVDWARDYCSKADTTMAAFIEERIEACRARFKKIPRSSRK